MTTIAGTVITEVLRRVRDEQAAGHTRTFTLEIVSHAQRFINRVTKSVTVEATLNLEPKRLVYDLTGDFPDCLLVTSARYQGEELISATLSTLRNVDLSWPRNVKGSPRVFSQVGLDLLVIYPVPLVASSLSITYVKDTGLIAGQESNMDLPDHAIHLVSDLATIFLLIRQRDFEQALKILGSMKQSLQVYQDE